MNKILYISFLLCPVMATGQTWTYFDSSKGAPATYFALDIQTDSNHIWVTDEFETIHRFDMQLIWETWTQGTSGLPSTPMHVKDFELRNDTLNVMIQGGGLYHYNGSFWDLSHFCSGLTLSNMDQSDLGFWAVPIAGSGYLVHFKNDGTTDTLDQFNSTIPSAPLMQVAVDGNGDVWGRNTGVVGKWDGLSWTTVATPSSAINIVEELFIDQADNIWVGKSDLLWKWDGAVWTEYDTSNSSLPAGQIRVITEDESGNLWLGIDNVGIVKFDGSNFTVEAEPGTLTGLNSGINAAQDLDFDEFGNLWAACGNYLFVLNTSGLSGPLVGIEEQEIKQLEVYPNPSTNGVFTISEQIRNVKITDMQGKVIYEHSESIETIDLSGYASGLYQLTATDQQNLFRVAKLLIE